MYTYMLNNVDYPHNHSLVMSSFVLVYISQKICTDEIWRFRVTYPKHSRNDGGST